MTMLCATPHQSESDHLTLSEQPLPPATVSSCGATPPAVDRQNTLKREEKSGIEEQIMPTHVIEEWRLTWRESEKSLVLILPLLTSDVDNRNFPALKWERACFEKRYEIGWKTHKARHTFITFHVTRRAASSDLQFASVIDTRSVGYCRLRRVRHRC